MFTIYRSKHRVYSFCAKISVFFLPTKHTIKSPKFRLKNRSLSYTYNPAFSPFCKTHSESNDIVEVAD